MQFKQVLKEKKGGKLGTAEKIDNIKKVTWTVLTNRLQKQECRITNERRADLQPTFLHFKQVDGRLQVYLVLLHLTGVAFLQIEGKTVHQQKHCSFLYCDTCLIMVIWTEL